MQLGDTIVNFPVPISGANGQLCIPPGAYLRVAVQCVSATLYTVAHPGGSMTGSLQIAPSNPSRARYTLLNSGSLAAALGHGTSNFNPTTAMAPGNLYDNVVAGGAVFTEADPGYTGPVRISWIGSGSLSGSVAVFADYSLG